MPLSAAMIDAVQNVVELSHVPPHIQKGVAKVTRVLHGMDENDVCLVMAFIVGVMCAKRSEEETNHLLGLIAATVSRISDAGRSAGANPHVFHFAPPGKQ